MQSPDRVAKPTTDKGKKRVSISSEIFESPESSVLSAAMITDDDDACLSATDSAFGGTEDEVYRIDYISELPDEIGVHILSYVATIDTFADLSCVSKLWCRLMGDNEVWKQLYLRKWRPLASLRPNLIFLSPQPKNTSPSRPRTTIPKSASQESVTDFNIDSTPPSTKKSKASQIQWKKMYQNQLKLQKNWHIIPRPSVSSFVGHDDAVYCIQSDPNCIVSGSRDCTIKFWTHNTFQCKKVIRGHKGSVLCLQYDNTQIISGSSDSTIIVWDVHTGEKQMILVGHASSVLDVRFNDTMIVSCSKDCTVKVWDRWTGKLLRTLEGHRAAVNAVHVHKNEAVTASGDCLVKLWNIETGLLVREFIGHSRGLACVQFDGKLVVSGSNDRTIRVWEASTGKCLHVLEGHNELVRTLCFDEYRVVSGSYDTTIKVWDIKTGELLHTLDQVHNSWIFHVQMDPCRIISAGQDRKIAVWNFSEGVEMAEEFL